ncbi:5-methylcytosine-specific restriction endonuclease system specificity protein McrC [Bifidobacterium sp. SO4]|uniref:5-methylcytosine-specific restriction endonuclease system specificity protein McrC n=1 Tax=Bifidobacterium sp. SO4 TaxID=2809030 RepID=UPI001BDD4570|nr:5-methylcytosine-specific restriction endonuclease system specificity protein McrC [Bifidobacterium sp. SO4]MBT1171756.1 5-methylcytosine-specific restriction endonuclease system specificity protein McrC [Bifidobacterium sp. SO4]
MIPVRNVYQMLSYALDLMDKPAYREFDAAPFDNAADLCAAILCRGVETQVKRGLRRDYRLARDEMATVRGRIDLSGSLDPGVRVRRRLVCEYDDFTVDEPMNRIVKSTMLLLTHADIGGDRRRRLRALLRLFEPVGTVDVRRIDWHMGFDRSNRSYRILLDICRLVIEGLIQTDGAAGMELLDFFDEATMNRLYERFILNYYRREMRSRLRASAKHIDWALDPGSETMHLPQMRSDAFLETDDGRILIIDAKYYTHTMQDNYGKHTIHSGNLYQMFSYVKNTEAHVRGSGRTVSGMLLYAKTDENDLPDDEYRMDGNLISVRTLDLDQEFDRVKADLQGIAERYLQN